MLSSEVSLQISLTVRTLHLLERQHAITLSGGRILDSAVLSH